MRAARAHTEACLAQGERHACICGMSGDPSAPRDEARDLFTDLLPYIRHDTNCHTEDGCICGMQAALNAFRSWLAAAPRADSAPTLLEAVGMLLDAVDYLNGACGPTEMVAAVLPIVVLDRARAALAAARATGREPT